ncbi:unnamed protein product [Prorocentrum cordatum]|uniref:Uncharacterized protein n=1 Tax=Prorocentrum cordatum TaxID=2364126 RepID=A0ABN9PPR6_9DINO|nr:unnamed protein product [Polarella glacialis]
METEKSGHKEEEEEEEEEEAGRGSGGGHVAICQKGYAVRTERHSTIGSKSQDSAPGMPRRQARQQTCVGRSPRRMHMHMPTSYVLVASWLARSPPDDKTAASRARLVRVAGRELGPARVRPGASSARREVGQARVFQPAEEAKPRESARAAGCEFGWARSRPGANCSAPGGGRAGGECMSRWVPICPFPSGPARASNPRSPSLPPRILRRAHPHTHSARLVATKAHSSGKRRCPCAKETPAELIRSRWSLEETFAKKRAT